ncbi:hypothetical protein FA13DRAFT_1730552 [Coprinellus micaceus]|uniref:Uncharacterized protein n=1 Tax=Coprinellus micaceus TaxID=71717 RepID=A0A4Y7TH81_COPMI|nr:hypothetical protein FA13DRAFT_1730552 [Coprinellus micaceus]
MGPKSLSGRSQRAPLNQAFRPTLRIILGNPNRASRASSTWIYTTPSSLQEKWLEAPRSPFPCAVLPSIVGLHRSTTSYDGGPWNMKTGRYVKHGKPWWQP